MHLLARLWDVTAGAIRLGGVDVRQLGTQALHERVAIVFQDVVLFSGSVRDNLLIGKPDATPAEVEAAARRAHAHDFIMALPQGYDTMLSENAESLSGGERQRLSIARALLKDCLLYTSMRSSSPGPPWPAATRRRASISTRPTARPPRRPTNPNTAITPSWAIACRGWTTPGA